jgi:hypothetical protein
MMPHKNDNMLVQEYVYDFDVDGGVKDAAIVLSDKERAEPLPVGAIVKAVTCKVLTQLLSDGSATIVWGNGDDQDGYSGPNTGTAVAGFTANALFNGYDNAAALLWDDTNDHPIPLNVADADDGEVSMLIETADLTAGKMVIAVEYLLPAASA